MYGHRNLKNVYLLPNSRYVSASVWLHEANLLRTNILVKFRAWNKHNMQCTVTWLTYMFMQSLLQWERIEYYISWVCVCSLRYPAGNARAQFCHLWPFPLYSIFPNCVINGTILKKKKMEHRSVFWFPVRLLSETFLILRRTEWARYGQKVYIDLHVNYPLFSSDFNKTCIFSTNFGKKHSHIKFHVNPSSGIRVILCG